jgi:hypothetical protein
MMPSAAENDPQQATDATPTTIEELIGRPSRYYTTGDVLTDDLIPERVNIEVNNDREIVRIWFG